MIASAFFAEREERVDFAAFDRLMRRKRGEAPRPEDTCMAVWNTNRSEIFLKEQAKSIESQ
jgi:hypothetical protein